ncbi:calmodulin-like protein 6 [Diospyros lotus]|uniref:calmodulin-like protein 6 n=1 Tax=Diospyros lotus TaxID=55363 RepID=UPI002251079E|nr:calmodulin-like protein 6 [Diospyros lotus]
MVLKGTFLLSTSKPLLSLVLYTANPNPIVFVLYCLSFSLALLHSQNEKRKKMFTAIVLLSILFIASLVYTVLNSRTKKPIVPWLKSLFTNPTSQDVASRKPAGAMETEEAKRTSGSGNTQKNKGELKGVFATFDKDRDGFITKKELRDSFKNIGMSMTEEEVEEMVERVDANKDGLIDLEEFYELVGAEAAEGEGGGGEAELKEAFGVFDGDGDGLITVEELRMVLGALGLKEGGRLESCREMIRKVDADGDGMVNFEEFKKMMKAVPGLSAIS